MTPARLATIDHLGPAWLLDPAAPLDRDALTAAFGRSAPVLIDIGVGNGDATRAWAMAAGDHDVLAIELHRPGIAKLLRRLDADGPTNVRVVDGDATTLLPSVEPSGLTAVRVLFPDPWPKRRHRKRRLLDQDFVALVADRLAPGGCLHVATDWLAYADHARVAMAAAVEDGRLVPVVDHDDGPVLDEDGEPVVALTRWRTDRPDRPITAYERRGLDAGRTVTDLVAVKA